MIFTRYHDQKRFLTSMAYLTVGTLIFSFSYCAFAIPHGVFGGGFTGIAQIIQKLLQHRVKLPIASKLDFTGIILWVINIPLLTLAYRRLSKHFVIKSLFVVFLSSFIFSFSHYFPVIIEDRLTSCLLGGGLVGFGLGTILKSGGSSGGTDIMGLLITQKHHGFSVGKIAIVINFFIYTYLGLSINLETAIYSIIYALVSSTIMDKVHYQNIQSAVIIISKDKTIGEEINSVLTRGVTHWEACGEYTKEPTLVYLTVVSKYEIHRLTTIVKTIDPKAFLIIDDNREVVGNFQKRFDA